MADKQPPVEEDVFGDVFKALSEDTPVATVAKTDPVTEGAVALEDAKTEAAKPAETPVEGSLPDPAKVGADGVVEGDEPAKPAPKGDDKNKLSDDELLSRFRDIVAEKPAAPPSPPAPAPAAAASPIAPYTAEEQKMVDDYVREWPDVYKAEQAIRLREYQALTSHIFNQLRPYLENLQSKTETLSIQTHMEQLQSAVPDYNEVAPLVVAWVDQQPAYLKAAYTAVVQSGTVADVADLIGRYKAATGTTTQEPSPAPAPAAQSPAVAKAVKGLAPVSSKRTNAAVGMIGADDFDGAFAEFAKAS